MKNPVKTLDKPIQPKSTHKFLVSVTGRPDPRGGVVTKNGVRWNI